ncbi:MAG: hypothetical protein LIO90_07405 [Bacteroidales bacterium]|nr:hypothetical protein [Bacteroidales bacterium]
MKYSHGFSALLSSLVLIAATLSCTSDEMDYLVEKNLLSTYPSSNTVGSSAGSFSLQLTATGQWSISTNSSTWVTASPTSGTGSPDGGVAISYLANTSASDSREATLIITSGDIRQTITLTQDPAGITFETGRNSFTLASSATSDTTRVTTNVAWAVEKCTDTDGNDVGWLSAAKQSNDDNILVISATANTTPNDREGHVYLQYNGSQQRILLVKQTAGSGYINIEPEDGFSCSGNEETLTLSIKSNVGWTVSLTEVSNPEWVTLEPTSGTGDGEVKITVAKNTTGEVRTKNIKIQADDSLVEAKTITITQADPNAQLSVLTRSLDFTQESASKEIFVVAKGEWRVTVNDEASQWCSVDSQDREAAPTGASVEVSVTANATGASREAVVMVALLDGSASQEVKVTQTSSAFAVSPTELSFAYNSTEAQEVMVTASSTDWTATPSDNWIKVREGKTTVEVSVSENTSGEARTGYVYVDFTVGDETIRETITVNQEALVVFELSTEEITFGFDDSATIYLLSSSAWTVTSYPSDWLVVTPTSGSGSLNEPGEAIRIYPAYTAGLETLSGEVVFESATGQRAVCAVSQPAVDVPEVTLTAVGGHKKITCNGTVTASQEVSSVRILCSDVNNPPTEDDFWANTAVSSSNTFSYTISDLKDTTTYYIRVAASLDRHNDVTGYSNVEIATTEFGHWVSLGTPQIVESTLTNRSVSITTAFTTNISAIDEIYGDYVVTSDTGDIKYFEGSIANGYLTSNITGLTPGSKYRIYASLFYEDPIYDETISDTSETIEVTTTSYNIPSEGDNPTPEI